LFRNQFPDEIDPTPSALRRNLAVAFIYSSSDLAIRVTTGSRWKPPYFTSPKAIRIEHFLPAVVQAVRGCGAASPENAQKNPVNPVNPVYKFFLKTESIPFKNT